MPNGRGMEGARRPEGNRDEAEQGHDATHRFLPVATRATEIAYVDMRYANGFAIGWRGGAGEVKRG